MTSSLSTLWQTPESLSGFRTGVCLHGHTLHSEECLSFLPRHLHRVQGISQIAGYYENGPHRVDFARAWWTPPLTPASALQLEREQILNLGLQPVVSLTDHDNIDAGMALQVTHNRRDTPVSVEWTVPFDRSIFHLGIHNLPPAAARKWMLRLTEFTGSPNATRLPEILHDLAGLPEVLIVLNHPFWREEGVSESDHRRALPRLIDRCVDWIHAFELNGTRPWSENSDTMQLANLHERPFISGGDRHAGEPSACVNLTNAESFAEFVNEVREGASSVLFLPQYREPLQLRVLEAMWDILRPYPEYPGRQRWTDRIYYRAEDGITRSLSEIWQDRVPWVLRPATRLIGLAASSGLKPALRLLLNRQAEVLQ